MEAGGRVGRIAYLYDPGSIPEGNGPEAPTSGLAAPPSAASWPRRGSLARREETLVVLGHPAVVRKRVVPRTSGVGGYQQSGHEEGPGLSPALRARGLAFCGGGSAASW